MTLFSNIYPPKTTPDSPEKLLIFHGFLGMSDNWKTLASQYAELGFQVHALDLRNHGKSFHSPDFSCELMVSDVLDYCQQQNILQTHVLGHSMGGKLAMFLATQNPGLVQKLIVADIAPRHYEPHHDNILTALQTVDFSTKPSRAAVEAELSKHIPDAGTRQFLLKILFAGSASPTADLFSKNAARLNRKASCPGDSQYRFLSKNCRVPTSRMCFESKVSTSDREGFVLKSTACNAVKILS